VVGAEAAGQFGDVGGLVAVARAHARDVGDGGGPVLVPRGVADRELGAPRVAGDRPPAEPEGRTDLVQVVNRLLDRERPVAPGRAPAAALVEPDHRELPVKHRRQAGQVVPQARAAVQEHDRRPGTADRRPQSGTVPQPHHRGVTHPASIGSLVQTA